MAALERGLADATEKMEPALSTTWLRRFDGPGRDGEAGARVEHDVVAVRVAQRHVTVEKDACVRRR